MGITLQGVGALTGGATQGFQNQRADNRAQAEENRTARDDAFQQVFNEVMTKRNDIDQPDPPPPPQAVPTGPPGATQGALPEDPNAQGPNTLGTMTVRGAQERPTRSRRDKYDEWLAYAQDAAVKAGGLEGLETFNQSERLISQQQVMGYGTQAVEMMANNSPADAAKLANTALEASPKDTGMEFFAMNGKLWLQGSEGEPSGPIDQLALQSMIETHLQDPDQWLDVRKQRETERAAREGEEDTDQQLDINRRLTEVQEGALPSQNLARSSGAYRDIAIGDAATQKALTATEEDLGWNNNNKLKIMNDLMGMQLDDKLGLDGEWNKALAQNPDLAKLSVSNMTDIVTYNPAGHVNYGDAAGIVRAAYGPSLGVSSSVSELPTKEVDGQYFVRFNGKEFGIPHTTYQAIQKQKDAGGQ